MKYLKPLTICFILFLAVIGYVVYCSIVFKENIKSLEIGSLEELGAKDPEPEAEIIGTLTALPENITIHETTLTKAEYKAIRKSLKEKSKDPGLTFEEMADAIAVINIENLINN